MALPTYDEAYTIPSPKAQLIALRTMQICAEESGAADTVDPLAGSYYVEALTSAMEKRIEEELASVERMGGIVEAVRTGAIQAEVARQAYLYEQKVVSGEIPRVAVNCHVGDVPAEADREVELYAFDSKAHAAQLAKLERTRAQRDGSAARTALRRARIVRVDTSRARALPGVLAVLTGEDVEQRPFGFAKDQLALKRGKVRCIRDEVAAVAAETPEIAEEALALIDADYAPLPAVVDPLAALEPGAPIVHEELATNAHHLRYRFVHGDVDRAFAEAAAVVEDTYRLNFVTPACLGTMVAIADWESTGSLTMWSTTQVPFLYQKDLGQALGIGGHRMPGRA